MNNKPIIWQMSKKYYLLLREKFRLEKKRDEVLSRLLQSILDWEFGGGSERKRLLEEYKEIMQDLKAIQQQLEPEFEEE